MLRRLAAILALSLAPASFADVAPWDLPAAPAPAPAPASGAVAPAAAAAPQADLGAFLDLLDLVAKRDLVEMVRGYGPEKRAEAMTALWTDLKPHERARFAYIASSLRENGSPTTARATTLLVLGPPQTMHSEPGRSWPSTAIPRIDDLQALRKRLLPDGGAPAGETITVSGELPTEVWVYPGKTIAEQRVVTFVDEDKDGTFRFASDEARPAASPASTAPPVEPPADLFPPVAMAGKVEDLPEITKPGLPIGVAPLFFKASAGRTYTRLVLTVDPGDVDLELSVDAPSYAAGARAVARVSQGGVPAWQGEVKLADGGGTATTPWMTELSVPLPPGSYEAVVVVVDAGGAGGKKEWTLEVPAFGGRLAVSTPVVARVSGDLPKVTGEASETLAPFQIGTYVVRPQPGATFKRGDEVAFVLQVYDAPSATIQYDLYRDGTFQSAQEVQQIKHLPSTQINIVQIIPAFGDGSYSLKATVKSTAPAAAPVVVDIPFRVRG